MKKITLTVILLFSLLANAQLNVNNTLYSPADLVLSKLIGAGVSVSNVRYNNSIPNALINNNQVGFYSTGVTPTNLGLTSGMIMTNGSATGAIGPNNAGGNTTPSNTPMNGDPDLSQIAALSINNICIIEFDFIPLGPEVKFEYVFGSEEYPEYVGSAFNDVFGFFLSGPGITGPFSNGAKNIALIPNSTTPISINNVNAGSNSAYYVSNAGGATIQYDGFTTVLTAKSEVQCGQTYHIKLALADVGDSAFDSGVFFKEGSFSVPEVNLGGDMVGPSKACCGEKLLFSTPFNSTSYPGALHEWYFGTTLIYSSTTSNTFEFDNATCTDGTLKVVVKPYPTQNCTFEDSIIIQYQYGPPLNVAPPLTLCSDNPATATGFFDLNMQINNIVPNFSSDYEDFGFYNTKEDAVANLNPIPASDWHNFSGVDNQSVFIGVSNVIITGNVCRSVMEFKLKFVNCDDFVCSPNPNSAVFDLTTRKPLIFNGFDPTKYSISFHNDMPSAIAGTGAITPENAYMLTANPQEIYVRYWENAVPLNKQFTQFTLQADQSNYAGIDGNLNFCIADTTVFNLFDYITGEQTGGTWSVVSGSGANVDLALGTISSNNIPGNYVLEYKVNASTNCPEDVSTVNIVIAAVCGVQTPPDLYLCDDSSNNGIEIFDLSAQNAIVLGTLSSADYTISYHVSSGDAVSGAFPITPNNAYPNISNPQTIYIRAVKNSDGSVFDTSKSFQLHVVPQPVVTSFTGATSICLGSSTNLTFVGTPNATVTYTDGTTTQPGVLLDATGNGSVTVSPTVTTTYSLVNIATTGTPGCTNPATGTVVITVTTPPTATITYTSPFCSNNAIPQTVSFSGTTGAYTGGTFSSTTGLTINATTGAITPSTSTAGTYIVVYTIPASGGCPAVPVNTIVTITALPAATIAYTGTPFCTSNATPQAVTLTGTTGGTYSSTAGLTIDSATGAITPSISTAGTYTVTYTMAAAFGCPMQTATTTVTITLAPTAAITYATPFCSNNATPQTVTFSGTTGAYTGGTFSSTTGLTINATTGAITPSTSTAGTYTVTYTIPASAGCAAVPVTTSVTITALPAATIAYVGTPFCTSNATPQPVTLTGTTGGTYSSTAGLTIDATTGAITASTSTAGTYTVTYTMAAANGCPLQTTTTTVTITLAPTATITYATPFCSNNATAQAVTFSGTAGAYTGGTFTSTVGLTINATTGAITPSTSTAGTYTVTYTIPASGGCAAIPVTTSVTITALPAATIAYVGTPFCTSNATPQPVTLTGTNGGTFTSTAGLTINATTGAITASTSTAGTYTVTYTMAAANGCPLQTTTTTVTITAAPTATITYTSPFCANNATPQVVAFSGTSGA